MRPPTDPALLREWRLRVYPRYLLAVPIVAGLSILTSAKEALTGGRRLGGDYPAFYGAGRIAAERDWDRLYDFDRQIEAQRDALPDVSEGILYFAYPPPVAQAYAPLARLDYHTSLVVHAALLMAAIAGSLWLLRPMSSFVRRRFVLALAISVYFVPLFRSILGGQNSAVSLLLLAAIVRLLYDERDLLLIVPFTLLLAKPQLVVPVVGLMLIARRWQAFAAAVTSVGLFWILGALSAGRDWFGVWLDHVIEFGTMDEIVAADINVSWRGALADLFNNTGGAVEVLGWSLVAVTIAVQIWAWWPEHQVPLVQRVGLLMPSLILMSPHAMFYDAGIVIISMLFAVDRGHIPRRALAAMWAFAWVEMVGVDLGVHPIFLIVIAIFGFELRAILRSRSRPAAAIDQPALA